MIQLTRLNNHPLIVNSDLIKFVENMPDTVLTLITGEKVIVSEPGDVVLEKIVEFRRKLLAGLSYQPATPNIEVEKYAAPPTADKIED
jgi:flagellar protein FlbD